MAKKSQKEENKSVSMELLASYRKALYRVRDFFESIQDRSFDVQNIDDNIKLIQAVLIASERLGKAIETLGILERKVESEEQMTTKVRGNTKLSLLENDEL